MRKNQRVPGTVSGWMRKHADGYKDRESLIAAVQKIFPDKDRMAIVRRINELTALGAIEPKPGQRGKRIASSTSNPNPKPGRKPTTKKVPKRFRMAVDVEQVKEEYDDESKIDEGIANLGSSIIKDNDFRMELGIALDRWKVVSTLERFSKNKIELRGKQFKGTYWGQQDSLADLRKKIDMT